MNLNVFSPGNAVESAFEKPNILLALLLVLIPAIIAAISFVVNSAPVDWASFAIEHIAKKYLLFFVSAILVFIVGMIFNSKEMQGRFLGIVSSISIGYVLAIIIALLSLLAPLIFAPEFMSAVREISSSSASQQEFFVNAQLLASTMPTGINFALLFVLIIITLILTLWQLFIFYKTISFVSKHKPWVNLASLAIILLLLGYASMLLVF